MTGTCYSLEVQPNIPERLARLQELANDLLYSWDRQVRGLFFRLDAELWEACGHNPKVFLRRVSQQRLDEAAQDRIFLEDYHRALSVYDTYHQDHMPAAVQEFLNPETDLVAYFCAEFGFHESLPIYSGGLGILAGDHCKAASDLYLPFVAVGLLYRQGYFTQTIDNYGNQVAHYTPTNFADLPIQPARAADGSELHVEVEIDGRTVVLKVWQTKAGHITLYLLDCDLPQNREEDRSITYQLYGGDTNTRIQQEIVLGIGGTRALRALGLRPNAWHINEGHAAFQILERCREHVKQGVDFATALELVAAATVFTTHTPVAAGHDIFPHELVLHHLKGFVKELGVAQEQFLQLGEGADSHSGFNMTALALRGSRFNNGVSRIHGSVAAQMESYVWPQIPPPENPIGYVTNGIHVPTFLAREWVNLFDMRFGGEWRNELLNEAFWQRIDDIPDHSFWSLRQSLKSELMQDAHRRIVLQHQRQHSSAAQIDRLTRFLNPDISDVLIIGFARRFATYKRATLLFSDPERLARLLNDPERPVLLMFAGKAHPNDMPGQHLIQVIHEFSRRPEFEGKILLLEGYDLALGRKLVTGVDVWLNNPEYPLEASGTSGQKAGINGVINLSVLDGWWAEGYNGENGWAITPHGPEHDAAFRNREESRELLDILEQDVIPLYFRRNGHGYSEGWVRKSKASMRSLLPHYNSQRMVMDYVRDYYNGAVQASARLNSGQTEAAHQLAQWKQHVRAAWPNVRIRRLHDVATAIKAGQSLPLQVAVALNGLTPKDVAVECQVGSETENGEFVLHRTYRLDAQNKKLEGETLFELNLEPPLPGLQFYKLRIYPYHELLSHPLETGCMLWV